MRSVLFALLIAVASLPHAGPQKRPIGKNCALSAPPQSAGEEFNHGVTLRVFPRAKDITSSYSGCQTLFAPHGNRWTVVSITEIVQGDPVGLWSPDKAEPELTACRYKNGRVVSGVAEMCAAPQFLLMKSLAPGCVEKIKSAVAATGISASQPEECVYE